MKRIKLPIVVILAVAGAYALGRYRSASSTGAETARRPLYYVDPMHPAYKSDKPGIAPDCGMKLEPVYADASASAPRSSLALLPPGAVSIDGATRQLLGIRLASVERGQATRTLRVVGRVRPEDTRVYVVTSGAEGFVRATFDDSVGVMVKKDQKLATCYSPDVLSVASGFLAASERLPGAVGKDGNRTVPFPGAVSKQGFSSIQGYTDRLRNLGMSDAQINRIADNRQLPDSVEVLAPVPGFILSRNISAGQHFERDAEFYRIADLSRVWVVAEVYEQDAPFLRPGAAAHILQADQGRQYPAHITDSLPASEVGGGTVKVRLEVENPGFHLRPDMLVDVAVPVSLPDAVTVPLDALVDSGAHARVYVEREEGVFEPREVATGFRAGERVEILHGVHPGERVVAAATFLVDSESRLSAPSPAPAPTLARESAAMVKDVAAKTVRDPSCGMRVETTVAAAAGNTLDYRGATYYFCSRKCKDSFEKNPAAPLIDHQGVHN